MVTFWLEIVRLIAPARCATSKNWLDSAADPAHTAAFTCSESFFWDGKESEPNKNEPNHNPGFAKNWNEHESKKKVQESKPNLVKNRTEPEPKFHGFYSVLSLNETVGRFTHFTVNEAFYFT